MATVLASNSFPQVEGTTRQQLFKKLARATGLLTYGVATGGTPGVLIDTTKLQSHQLNTGDNIGAWLRISSTTDGLAPVGQIRTVTGYQPDLGILQVNPNFTVAPAAGDEYELWRVDPSTTIDLLDECLTDLLYMPCWTVLSEVPDYDMEQSGTTEWASSNATLAKSSAEPRSSFYGKRYLTVTSNAANGYARTALLRVEPTKTYHASALASAASAGTASLVAYDETNDAVISYQSSTRLYPVRIYFTFTVPSNCYTVSLRLVSVESGLVTNWDEVCFYPIYAKDIALPWWVKTANQVKGVFQMEPLTLGLQIWDSVLAGERDSRWDKYDIAFGRDQLRAVCRIGTLQTFPVFILGTRNETAYTDDTTDIKRIDPNLLLACLKYKLYEYLSQPLVTGILDAANIKDKLATTYQEYMQLQQTFATSLNVTIGSPTPSGRFIDQRFTFGYS